MRTRSGLLASAAFVALLGCTVSEQRGAAAEEIIVKFADGDRINESILLAFDGADENPSLQVFVQELSNELGVPLTYSRLTSGREVVVAIPATRVYDMIAERLRGVDEVEDVVIENRAFADALTVADEIIVTVNRDKIAIGPGVDADALGQRLVGSEQFPVVCNFLADGRLAITPDLEQLATSLVTKLSGRPDIEYAQRNTRVQHYEGH